MRKLLLLIVFAAAIMNVFGTAKYWVGGATGNWANTSSWSLTSNGTGAGAAIPVATDDVYFNAASGASVIAYCIGSTPVLNSLNATSCKVTFAIVPATTQAITTSLSTSTKDYTLSASNASIVVGQCVYVYSGDGKIGFGTSIKTIAGTAFTLNANPTANSTSAPTLAFVPSAATTIITKSVTLNNAHVISYVAFAVNGRVGDGIKKYDFSFLGSSTFTQAPLVGNVSITLGSGGTFYMTGNSATNYFDWNVKAKITFNTTSTLNVYFNQISNSIAGNGGVGGINNATWGNGWANINNTNGTINIMNSVAATSLAQNAPNGQTLVLGANTTFTLSGNSTNSFGNDANAGAIDASNPTCKFIITSGHATILTSTGTILKPGTASAPINWFELNRNGATYTPYAPMFVKNLVLTAGTINNSTNNITVVKGGAITSAAGKLLVPSL